MTQHTSKAAAERLAKGIVPGDFVLFGEYVLKTRVPLEADVKGSRDGYFRTRVPFMGKVVEVTPTGRLRIEIVDNQGRTSQTTVAPIRLLNAHDSLRAVKMTEEQVERRSRCLSGWE